MTPDKSDPMAWLAFATDGSGSRAVYCSDGEAQAAADAWGWTVMPLYLAPRLTDAEREAVALMAEVAADPRGVAVLSGYEVAATLRGLLDRLSPVATPETPCTPGECRLPTEFTDTGEK